MSTFTQACKARIYRDDNSSNGKQLLWQGCYIYKKPQICGKYSTHFCSKIPGEMNLLTNLEE